MTPFRIALFVIFAFACSSVGTSTADAATVRKGGNAKKASAEKRKKQLRKKRRRNRKKRRRGKRRGSFRGHAVPKGKLRTEPLPKPSGELSLYMPNFREELELNIFDEHGNLDEEALSVLDHGFRCKRTREVRAADPRLAEILSIIYDHYGKKQIELISGFRFQKNEGSRHYHASAVDIRVKGVSTRDLYRFAETLDSGGMGIGIYPRAGFVHIDFRAPGDPSYRWTDTSRGGTGTRGNSPSRKWNRRQPGS